MCQAKCERNIWYKRLLYPNVSELPLCFSSQKQRVYMQLFAQKIFQPHSTSCLKTVNSNMVNKQTKTKKPETVESYEEPFSNRHTHTNKPLRLLYTNANLHVTDVLHFFFEYHTLHKNALCARLGFIHLLLFILSIGTTSGKSWNDVQSFVYSNKPEALTTPSVTVSPLLWF